MALCATVGRRRSAQQCVARLEAEAAKGATQGDGTVYFIKLYIRLPNAADAASTAPPPRTPCAAATTHTLRRRHHAHPAPPHLLHAAAASPLWRHHRRCPTALAR